MELSRLLRSAIWCRPTGMKCVAGWYRSIHRRRMCLQASGKARNRKPCRSTCRVPSRMRMRYCSTWRCGCPTVRSGSRRRASGSMYRSTRTNTGTIAAVRSYGFWPRSKITRKRTCVCVASTQATRRSRRACVGCECRVRADMGRKTKNDITIATSRRSRVEPSCGTDGSIHRRSMGGITIRLRSRILAVVFGKLPMPTHKMRG